MRYLRHGILPALLLGSGLPALATAQEANHLYDRYQVSVSGALVLIGSTIRVDTDEGDGTELDSEDDLGLDRSNVRPRLAFRWRPGRRHELEAAYLPVTRTGGQVLERDVVIDSVTYTAGAELESSIRNDQLGVDYRYAIHAGERTLAGLAAGVGVTWIDTRFTGTGTVTGGAGQQTGSFTVEESLRAPTVAIGGFGQFRVGDRWYVDTELGGFYLDIDNINIRILQVLGAVRYYPLTWLGLELGYTANALRVDIRQ
jgi:hypothetical protein